MREMGASNHGERKYRANVNGAANRAMAHEIPRAERNKGAAR